MPRDVSSSSSEDEADSPRAQQNEMEKKTTKYQCPGDFVTFCHEPCSSTLTDRLLDKNTELWLIKAPVSFKPERFGGLKVPLAGLQTLKAPADGTGGGQQIYSILASNQRTSDLRLLTAERESADRMVFSPAFSGLLNVCESYGDSSANQTPQVIPAAPAPAIPPGLKQRFHPFGSKTPTLTCVADNEVDGSAFGPSSTTLRPRVVKRFVEDAEAVEDHEEKEEEKKKKKKKKEKRIKTEQAEQAVRVKQEPAAWIQEDVLMGDDLLEDEQSEERRKKKKKKKDREREEVEEGLEPSARVKQEAVTIKFEPADCLDDEAAEGSARKKKKKKKCKMESE
ncbi:unnamed protein product [Ophioblennius macclurei]